MSSPSSPPPDSAAETRPRELYRIGDLLLDAGARRVERGGEPLVLKPHGLSLLLTLARRSPDACSNDELLEAVWPETHIGEESVKQQVMLIRKAIGDDTASPRYVETVRGYGYRLAQPAERVAPSETTSRPFPRFARTAVLAALPVLLAVAALWVWLARSGPEDRKGTAGPETAGLAADRVFVEVFQNRTGDPRYDAVALQLCDRIASRLAASRRVDVVAATSVALASARGTVASIDRARSARAAFLLDGAITPGGDGVQIEAVLLDVDKDGVRSPVPPVPISEQEPGGAVEALVDHAVAAVAAAMDPSLATLGAGAGRPISLEAYDDYATGLRLFTELRFAEALPYFERAADRAARFGSAGLMTLQTLANLGRLEEARRIAGELRHLDLPPFDRGVLLYHEAGLAGNWNEALVQARDLAQIAPESPYAYAAASAALLANRPREAIERLGRIDPDGPLMQRWLPYWYYLTLARHALGQSREELGAALQARRRFPADRGAIVMQARALAAIGDESGILELLHATAATPTEPLTALRTVAWVGASELAAHGLPEAARRIAEAGLALRAEPEAEPVEGRDKARLLGLVGRNAEAAQLLAALRRQYPERLDLLGEHGLAALAEGEPATAIEIRRELAEQANGNLGEPLFWRAALVAAEGDTDAALILLQAAVAAGFPVWHTPSLLDVSLQIHAHPALSALAEDSRFHTLLWPSGPPEDS